MNAEEEVLAKLDRLGALLFARDPAVVGEPVSYTHLTLPTTPYV